jgi:hypothetical protein
MISINGKNFYGNTVIVTNDRVISQGKTGKPQKFNERKNVYCNDIDEIIVDSMFADVEVSVSDSPKAEAHFWGSAADVQGDVDFKVQVINRKLNINLKITGKFWEGKLKLEISIPKRSFKKITVTASSANITLNGVMAEQLNVNTLSGNVKLSPVEIENASISTMNGDVNFCAKANQDIFVNITTMNGDVSAEFKNIQKLNISTKSTNGTIKNRHAEDKGYSANGSISTKNGDINIK